ncbi:hypothetical protein LOTGIDRAFT_235432 [Lottia gigantea]|uniref:TROVE domain-containing protein n=1 Tax=Lottia gigantea TaxID=225164 RepID=V3ZZG1_LOTGI|nr:hypothetical protein LOTGIDRAFT_235432 [Lottia gigantea]ESO86371.1 hypothetical protein LOTGIDRAFT_235432 [Lottia gigantea]
MPIAVTDLDRLRRFLSHGSDTGVLIIGNAKPTKEDLSSIDRLISEGKGEEIVREVVRYALECRFVLKTNILFALAYCYKAKDNSTKTAASKAFPNICKHPIDLFYFLEYAKKMSDQHKGWGRSLRNLVSSWYNGIEPKELVEFVTRYKSCCRWSHVDVIRLGHVHPLKDETAIIIRYVMKGLTEATQLAEGKDSKQIKEILKYLKGVDQVKQSINEHEIGVQIRQLNLKQEHIPTKLQKSVEVWQALIPNLTIKEILSNIVKLASLGILKSDNYILPDILDRLTNEQVIKDSGVSPMKVLIALRNYEQGKGKIKWQRNESVANALNLTFSHAIKNNISVTNKRLLIAVKIGHGLPQHSVYGTPALSSMIAAAGLATIYIQSEDSCSLVFFSTTVIPVAIKSQMKVENICEGLAKAALPEIPVMACDVSAPIRWATDNKKSYDAIIILTDSKDSTGTVTPHSALLQYRKDLNLPNTKLIICGMTSRKMEYADSNDLGMLDIAGFDSTVPDIISNFVLDV